MDPEEAAKLDRQRMAGSTGQGSMNQGSTGQPSGSGVQQSNPGFPAGDADFGARPGQPSGTGSSFTTSDPGMADEPAEGGESEVDQ